MFVCVVALSQLSSKDMDNPLWNVQIPSGNVQRSFMMSRNMDV